MSNTVKTYGIHCSNCTHGGSEQMSGVRCMHPHWDDIGEPKESPYRVIDPEFAKECTEYKPKEKESK